MNGRCGYAHPGTYGHECGRPAVWAQQTAGEYTADGRYWRVRCDECRTLTGPDNDGTQPDMWVPYDPATQLNAWHVNRWPNPPTVKYTPA